MNDFNGAEAPPSIKRMETVETQPSKAKKLVLEFRRQIAMARELLQEARSLMKDLDALDRR